MATRLSAESLLGEERVERELEELRSQVQREKEKVRNYFHQLNLLLAAREESVLRELDEIVDRVTAELTEKRALLQQLNTAREGLERDLTENKLRELLQKNLRSLEDGIGEVLGGKRMTVGWVAVEWNVEGVKVSVSDVCKVVCLKEKPVQHVDYSVKERPVWSSVTRGKGYDQISDPNQIVIDRTTQNIFVEDMNSSRIQMFSSEDKHFYSIPDELETETVVSLAPSSELTKLSEEIARLRKSVDYLMNSRDDQAAVIESLKQHAGIPGLLYAEVPPESPLEKREEMELVIKKQGHGMNDLEFLVDEVKELSRTTIEKVDGAIDEFEDRFVENSDKMAMEFNTLRDELMKKLQENSANQKTAPPQEGATNQNHNHNPNPFEDNFS